jgi:hypothetical protein
MFWLYLLLRPRQRYVVVHYCRHPRFHHPLYWLSCAWVLELAFWELAGYVIVLYLLAKLVVRLAGARRARKMATA